MQIPRFPQVITDTNKGKNEYYLCNLQYPYDSIDVYTYAGYFLRTDCNKAEEGLKTTLGQ